MKMLGLVEGVVIPKQTKASTLKKLLRVIEATLDDHKGDDVASIPLKDKCSFADYMVVASGRSGRHVGSLADHVQKKLRESGFPVYSVEGKEQGDWVVIDCGDVVVHLFRPEVREFYGLEKMWSIPLTAQQDAVLV